MTRFYGRSAPVFDLRSVRSAMAIAPHLDSLGPAFPASTDWTAAVDRATGGDWGMMGNDSCGDCVWADSAHGIMLRTANASSIVVPTAADAVAAYRAVTGYDGTVATDRGTDETAACAYMRSTGILGHRSDDYATIDPRNLDHVKWCVQLFGTCRLGILVTPTMEQDFEDGRPWIAAQAGGSGHDVPIVKYDPDWAYVVTWGRLQRVSWAAVADPNFCEEAHSELYYDWARSQGPTPAGLSLDQLDQDLRVVSS